MEKKPIEKKFKQNACDERRKPVDDNEGNNIVKQVKNKKNNKYNANIFRLFD